MSDVLLILDDLSVAVTQGGATVVKSVSYILNRNEILCVVGESGSGKSVTAHAIMGLLSPDQLHVSQGEILYRGENLVGLPASKWYKLRGKSFGMVFQEPMRSEEHTSELQSLMRISYAVFCLKKKKKINITSRHRRNDTQ